MLKDGSTEWGWLWQHVDLFQILISGFGSWGEEGIEVTKQEPGKGRLEPHGKVLLGQAEKLIFHPLGKGKALEDFKAQQNESWVLEKSVMLASRQERVKKLPQLRNEEMVCPHVTKDADIFISYGKRRKERN